MNYSFYYKTRYAASEDWATPLSCDVYISAFNKSDRVTRVFSDIRATKKIWIVHPEYSFTRSEMPAGAFSSSTLDEAEFVNEFLDWASLDFVGSRIVIDSTGFMRPQLMFLLRALVGSGVHRIEVTYSEPGQYAARENTQFAAGTVSKVRQVRGFAGSHPATSASSDLLIIGSGYEHDLIGYVADDRKTARRVQIFTFPSLQPDFYQESILRAARAREAVGTSEKFFAPANDPFETAGVLSKIVARERMRGHVDNLYLSPLATKAQALGFAFFYIRECVTQQASVIFPFSDKYHPETSTGFSGIWHYVFEFP